MHDEAPETPNAAELGRGFDLAWARSSPAHELSAHGRGVQRRLDTPVAKPANPSLLKRFRFAVYRWRRGH